MLRASTINSSCSPKPIARIIGRRENRTGENNCAKNASKQGSGEGRPMRGRLHLASPSGSRQRRLPAILPSQMPIRTDGNVSDAVGASSPIIIERMGSSMPKTNGRL